MSESISLRDRPTPVDPDRCLFVLGASDPEMLEIERILRDESLPYVYAGIKNRRVTNANCHKASTIRIPSDMEFPDSALSLDSLIFLIECDFIEGVFQEGQKFSKINAVAGDPSEYMNHSSIGILLKLLKRSPTPRQRLIAAADHCLTAAYQGMCPGVDPADLAEWRVNHRARHQRIDPEVLNKTILKTMEILEEKALDGLVDLSETEDGTLPELPEASARLGINVISRVTDNGRQKLVHLGSDSDRIMRWEYEMNREGYETYGEPLRGFAGAYL